MNKAVLTICYIIGYDPCNCQKKKKIKFKIYYLSQSCSLIIYTYRVLCIALLAMHSQSSQELSFTAHCLRPVTMCKILAVINAMSLDGATKKLLGYWGNIS